MGNFAKIGLFITALALTACGGSANPAKPAASNKSDIEAVNINGLIWTAKNMAATTGNDGKPLTC